MPKKKKPRAAGRIKAPDTKRIDLRKTKRFVLTSAQNNTYVHDNFFKSLDTFCRWRDAQLIVGTFTYNKNGFQNSTKSDDSLWYDPKLKPFIQSNSATLAHNLIWCGELDILPTATKPLVGFENYVGEASGVIPHAKLQMLSLPRAKGTDPRFLYTTGCVTKRNYIQRKAGQKAEFHHVFGALYVEVDEHGEWFARQLIADDSGEFYDLTDYFTPDRVETGVAPLAVNLGDIHVEHQDPNVTTGMFDMLKTLSPVYALVHDLTDFQARNHHNLRDPHFLAKMLASPGKGMVEYDMALSAAFLRRLEKLTTPIVVQSNHHDAFNKWLREADIRQDPINAAYFHTCNAKMFEEIRRGVKDFNPYVWAVQQIMEKLDEKTPTKTLFLQDDESFSIGGVECGMHGHRGPNGSRGSVYSIKNIGRRVNLGHSHSATIADGCYVAGVSSSLDLGYNVGPSSWSHSHIITYRNGKRTIITQRGKKWQCTPH